MPSSRGTDRRPEADRIFAAGVAALTAALQELGPAHWEPLYALAEAVDAAWDRGGKLLICGNGGSAADSQHIAAELVGRYLQRHHRPAYAALALTTNASELTAIGNDYGFDQIFARQVEGLGRPGDVLLVISTSGNSPNCVRAVAAARRAGLAVFGFLGGDGGELAALVDAAIVAPSASTPEIQEIHITCGHLLCRLLEEWRDGDDASGREPTRD
jgi:D-sedoheptulose 7-phosphate isomerase